MAFEATVQTRHGLIKVEGDTQSDLFKEMASTYEVFDEKQCGLCQGKDIRPVVRRNKDEDEFYEYQCQGTVKNGDRVERCRGYLSLGQNKKGGGLFPIRALTEAGKPDRAEGKFGRHNGWTRYRGEPKQDQKGGGK
jgi:hypothetical protein